MYDVQESITQQILVD